MCVRGSVHVLLFTSNSNNTITIEAFTIHKKVKCVLIILSTTGNNQHSYSGWRVTLPTLVIVYTVCVSNCECI